MLGHDLEQVFQKEDFIALTHADLDITKRDDVFAKFMTIQPDVVINASGYTKVDDAEKDVLSATDINGYAVGILAQASREIGATFVHFSSDYVFDGTRPQGYPEDSPTNPLNVYGQSKEIGEKLLIEEMEMQRSNQEMEGYYFLIRTSWLFGKHGHNFVDTMLRLGRQKVETEGKNAEIKVVSDQHGKPTYTLDLAQQVKWLVESREYPSGIYHISNEEVTSWFDFAQEIFRLANIPVRVLPCTSAEYPRPAKRPHDPAAPSTPSVTAKRPHHSALVNTKLPPLRPWKEALAAYLAANEELRIKN